MSKNYCPYCMAPVPEGESCAVCGLTAGTYIPSPHHLPPGTILMNRYLVGRVLGEGGFGITYIGCDLRLELKVAIKEYYPVDRATRNASASLEVTNFIGPSAKSFERGKQKFLGEAQVMARMDKQQVIVSVRDFFEINNTAYIVMEYIEGITFRELVEKKGGKISEEELFPMIEPLFHALSMMHENGLIHRDISPDNLMLENGEIRLLDFGCAREASRGTETMTIALKHGYAPIEQYQQKGQGPWTDIYALSATIYYCLTGKVPPQALDRITEDELLLPGKLGIHLSAGREKALLKGMKLQPNRRFASAEEMWRAIYIQQPDERDGAEEKAETEEAIKEVEKTFAAVQEPVRENVEEGPVYEVGETAHDRISESRAGGEEKAEPEQEEMSAQEETSMQEEMPVQEEMPAQKEMPVQEEASVHTEPAQPVIRHFNIWNIEKAKLLLGVGIILVCVVVFSAIWMNYSNKSENVSADSQSMEAEAGEDKQTNAEDNILNAEKDTEAVQTNPHLFDQAVTFTGGDNETFQKLMEDNTVEAVIIDCDYMEVSRAAITKPVLLSEGVFWPIDSLIIAEEGYLQVEGNLDMSYSGYLRMYGKNLCLHVTEKGMFQSNNAFVWMDNASCIVIEGDNGNVESPLEHRLVLSEDVFENSNVNSVTDFTSLQRAIETGKPVSIDGDITLKGDLDFNVPVRISEGVTVKTMQNEEGKWHHFVVNAGAVLINNGTFTGELQARNGGTIINNNTLIMEVAEEMPCASLWIEDQSAVINFGTIDASDTSRFWTNSLLVNLGDFNCYDFYLSGGNMANLGNVIVAGQNSRFEILNGSRLWNKTGGVIDVREEAEILNDAWINNTGEFIVGYKGWFENTMFENNGIFRIENGGRADADRSGVYFGSGEYDIGSADIKVYNTSLYDSGDEEGLTEVTNEEELLNALESSKAEAVIIRGDIIAHKDLTIRKNLIIDYECSLTMADGAAILDYGSIIMLKEGSSLQGSDITLQEEAQIYMEGESDLIVDENGTLLLDSSVMWGWGAAIELSKAAFTLENEAGFAFQDMKLLNLYDSEILLQNKSVFAMPLNFGEMHINGSTVTLSNAGAHSCFYTTSDTELNNCNLNIEAGVLRNRGENLKLQNCSVDIAQSGEFVSDCSNLKLLSGTILKNEGFFSVCGWDEYEFMVHGKVENYGVMEFGITHIDLSEPINNQNKVYYFGSHYQNSDGEWNDAYVTGNTPIDYDTLQ